ncbi:MAG TPA: hypothetical protein VHY80_21860 [Stellaceae bacterium]|nr:hypothetical protein [Stellaceae bacterium]
MRGSTPAQRASRRARVAGWRLAILAPLALAACSNFAGRANTYTCPASMTVPELQTLVTVVPGPNGAAIQSSGRINQVTTECDREGDTGVASKVTIEFAGLRTTPAINQISLPYFVALADATGNILGKQQYTETLGFAPDAQVTKALDNVTVHIPLKNAQLGNVYTLVVGFQLTQSQLDYNRAHLQK